MAAVKNMLNSHVALYCKLFFIIDNIKRSSAVL